MLANLLIGLREGLEAALIVGILAAYLVRTGQRSALRPLWGGVAAAVAASIAAALILTATANGLPEQAEKVFAGTMSWIAVGLITWMVFWMASKARSLRGELHANVDRALTKSTWALALVAFVAVGREGLETAIFLWSSVRATGGSAAEVLAALAGIAIACLLGWLIYQGSLRINLAKLFTVTGVALIVVAAGLLSYGIHEFQEAGFLPGEENLAFDVSGVIDPDGWVATLLKGALSLTPAMSWAQVIGWFAYLIPTLVIYLITLRRRTTPATTATTAATADAPVVPTGTAPERQDANA